MTKKQFPHGDPSTNSVAVIAHKKKSLGGGLEELRQILYDRGVTSPTWYEASRSRDTAKLAKKAAAAGAELIFLWGGDGTVQRCVNALAGQSVEVAILPAGTANLLATNLGVPVDLAGAVDVGLTGDSRRLDLGVLNGKRFAVMAGIGFDAIMMRDADGKLKDKFGQLAYVWTGARALRVNARTARVRVDGNLWFSGRASCILIGQMGTLASGISVFPDSQPNDGLLDVGVVTAQNVREWTRVLARLTLGHAEDSPLTQMTTGRRIEIKLDRPTVYELDGGARKARRTHRAHVEVGALRVRVPQRGPS